MFHAFDSSCILEWTSPEITVSAISGFAELLCPREVLLPYVKTECDQMIVYVKQFYFPCLFFYWEDCLLISVVSNIIIAVGIFLIAFGIFTWKYNPKSWSRNAITWAEQSDWSSYIFTGAFLMCGGLILYWLGF